MQKVLVIIPHWDCETYAYCLDKAVEYQLKGYEVSIVDFSRFHSEIYRNWALQIKNFVKFRNSTKRVYKEIVEKYGISEHFSKKSNFDSRVILDESEQTYFHNILKSTLTKYTGDRYLNLNKVPREVYYHELHLYLAVKNRVSKIISEFGISLLITVNGRFVVDGAVARVAHESGSQLILLERGRERIGGVEEFKISPQSLTEQRINQKKSWDNAGERKIQSAKKGLELKRSGILESNWRSRFINVYQQSGDNNHKLAVFFPSTDLEFSPFEHIDQEFNVWSQVDAFKAFCEVTMSLGYKVIVRVHPVGDRRRKIGEFEDELWTTLCRETGSDFISSFSSLDSYSLLNNADLCATYSSSIGVDCLLLGKRTIVLGATSYSHLVPEHCAQSLKEIKTRMSEKLTLKNVELLLPWGYYYYLGGNSLRLFQVSPNNKLTFNGRELNEVRKIWIRATKVLKLPK